MKYGKRWAIDTKKKEEYISRLLPQLSVLRAKADLSQDELANLVGISRQTYCLTESGARGMSWNTYLSLVMFFNYNKRTHDLIRSMGVFPEDLFYQFNPGEEKNHESSFEKNLELNNLFMALDNTGKNTVRTILAAEFARCTNMNKAQLMALISELVSDNK